MRLLALGAGDMGAAAAVAASSFDEIHELTVADLNLDNARRVVSQCGGKGVAVKIDVTDHDALVALMRASDATMNCVGPFFRFGVPILQAAIDAQRPYCDICDDPEPTLEMLRMTDKAQASGTSAIIGMGASPGVTDLLARMAYESLDTVDELATAWNVEPVGGDDHLTFSMAIVHWMRQISGMILEWRNGRLENVPPLGEEWLHYPGRGTRRVWTVGHPEPISLSRTYPGLKRSFCAMVMSSMQSHEFLTLRDAIDRGELTLEQAAHKLVESSREVSWFERTAASIVNWLDGPRMPMFFAVARGSKDGVPTVSATSMRASPKDMARATGIPLALAARLFAQGKIPPPGVYPPEAVIDPAEFFDVFHPYCSHPAPVVRDALVETAVSRDPNADRISFASHCR